VEVWPNAVMHNTVNAQRRPKVLLMGMNIIRTSILKLRYSSCLTYVYQIECGYMNVKSAFDRTDLAILSLLAKNARMSNKELAAAVGLAPSSCHERLKTLREKGAFLGAHADVNLRSIGLAVEALLFVQVAKMGASQVDDFLQESASVPEVRNVFLVSGHFDLIVHVAVCDMEHLKRVISDRFHQAFVVRVETSIVFNHMTHHEIPIAEIEI
jgi:DNA-binding Lrp family transcriptional regulator